MRGGEAPLGAGESSMAGAVQVFEADVYCVPVLVVGARWLVSPGEASYVAEALRGGPVAGRAPGHHANKW